MIRVHLLFSCHLILFLLSCMFPFVPFLSIFLSALVSFRDYDSCSDISSCSYHYANDANAYVSCFSS